MVYKLLFHISVLLFPAHILVAQDSVNTKRKNALILGTSVSYTAGMYGLHQLWYRDQSSGSFRFFNDNAEWQQMDKWGHAYTAYHLSGYSFRAFRWAGYSREKSLLYASMASFGMMLPIEVFDGFSEAYGFSWGDVVANGLGVLLFWGQESHWHEQKILIKYSFSRTDYAAQRPALLGNNLIEEMIKDYNGQTYWLSFSPFGKSFQPGLQWLCLSLGYTADDMIFARNHQNAEIGLNPGRGILFSLDIDFSKFDVQNKYLKTIFEAINLLKIPAPTIGFHQHKGLILSPLYY